MTFLNPLALLGAVALAIPLVLHLLHRRVGRRRAFPALRYLRRTEREHARRIRLRQILLLLLRMATLLLVVLAASRPVIRGLGGEHQPTALALVLDNSMSAGAVVGERRILDGLREAALSSVEAAGPEDRIWVFRAGQPWETPVPGGRQAARDRIRETSATGTGASLPLTVARARELVAAADLAAGEVHVFTDLQETSWNRVREARAPAPWNGPPPGRSDARRPPVLVFHPDAVPSDNRWISSVEVGGGLPPLVNQRTNVAVRVDAAVGGGAPSADTIRVRLSVDGRITAAVDAPVGQEILIPAGPFAVGGLRGLVEIDPDRLRADDRRHFTFRVRPPPRVGVAGEPGFFLAQALSVLADAGRIQRTAASPDVLVAPEARGLESADPAVAVVVLPPADPALLPAVNQRLRGADVPWRLETEADPGEARVRATDLPVPLDGVRVRRSYRLLPVGEGGAGRVRARRADDTPWIVTGIAEGRPYLLLASPLVPDATSLPLTAEMLPVVEWMLAGWAPGAGSPAAERAGTPLAVPPDATGVRDPNGTLHPVDGTLPFRKTGHPGIYELLRGDSVLDRVALNPPARESRLERLSPDALERRIDPPLQRVSDRTAWVDEIFLARRGREIWRPLLLAALALLAVESLLAAGGRGRDRSPSAPEGAPELRHDSL